MSLFDLICHELSNAEKLTSSLFDNYSDDDIMQIIIKSNELYHNNGDSPLSDAEYDFLYDLMKERNPNHSFFKKVGEEVPGKYDKSKLVLPIFMGSMNKIKDDKQITNWMDKYGGGNNVIVSAKMDGISGLFDTKTYGINNPKLYTRGNGIIGRDISYLLPYLELPAICYTQELLIRGELIMKKSTFNKYYSNECANSRNIVAGIVNQNYIDYETTNERNRYMDIDFISYNLYYPSMLSCEGQFQYMKLLNVKLPYYKEYNTPNWFHDLNPCLKHLKDNYDYMIDGIIISESKNVYPEMYDVEKRENPKWAFAYKNPEIVEIKQTEVIDVIWSASKDKYLKPKIHIKETNCDGSKINYVTGFNAKYIFENKIGPGSIIKVGLSGGVIPYVFDIVNTSTNGIGMLPDKTVVGDYIWSENDVDIILLKETKEVLLKKSLIFMKSLDIDTIGIGILKNIFQDDSISCIRDILLLSHDQWISYPKIGDKKYNLIHNSLKTKLPKGGLVEYMYGSQIFDRNLGMRKFHAILKDLGRKDRELFLNMWNNSFLNGNRDKYQSIIRNCHGISDKSANLFLDKVIVFNNWILSLRIHTETKTDYKIPRTDDLYKSYANCHVNITDQSNQPGVYGNVVLTGLRNTFSDFNDILKMLNLEINYGAINSHTKYVIKRDRDSSTTKVKKAIEKGIPILTYDEFVDKFSNDS